MYIDLERYLVFLLIMVRMTGMVVFNPIFGRQNIPTMFGAGLSFTLTILLYNTGTFAPLPDVTLFTFFYLTVKELSVGIFSGFVIRMFLSVLVVGGEIIDMQLGLSMSKAFDPATNASVSITAQILNVMFYIGFFQANAHLTLIKMTAKTFDIIPLGDLVFRRENFLAIPELFSYIFLLSIQLCIPIVVMEIIVTFAVGMVMRVVPQINIFILNIQLKIIIGIVALLILVPSLSAFCDNLLTLCFENIQSVWIGFT